jgi:hypothetical protein
MNQINLIKRAILQGKLKYKGKKLPTMQTAGTDSQISSYANVQAQKFYNQNIK